MPYSIIQQVRRCEPCLSPSLPPCSMQSCKITQDIRKVCDVSDSTLYPVLRRLLKAGALETYDQAVDGRMRRYYKITPIGRMQLMQYLSGWADYRDKIESVFFGGSSK